MSRYASGTDTGDNGSMYLGYDYDSCRWTGADEEYLPRNDNEDVEGVSLRFGSPHPGGFQAVYGDGSVRTVDYDIDPFIYSAMGSRNGREVVSVESQ